METEYILADDVNVSRPVFLEKVRLLLVGLVGVVTYRRDIVGQRVEPDIDDMTRVKSRNAPSKRSSRNAEILQTAIDLEEVVYHLFFARFRLDEFRVIFNIFYKAVCVLAHLEEVRLLLRFLNGSAAVGALAVNYLRVGEEGLAGSAVPTLVTALVNVALFVKTLEYFRNGVNVRSVGRSDEVVVTRIHLVPDAANLAGHLVDVLLRRHSGVFGVVFDFLTVLICSGAEKDVKTARSFVSRDSVCHNYLVSVAKMRLSRRVRDRRGYIIFRFVHSDLPPCCRRKKFAFFVYSFDFYFSAVEPRDQQIGVFADLKRSDLSINFHLTGRCERCRKERRLKRNFAEFHKIFNRGFHIENASGEVALGSSR